MKEVKSRFVVTVIATILVSIAVLSYCWNNGEEELFEVRTTFPKIIDFKKLDPSQIRFVSDYTMLEHLFSPLIEMDNNGNLMPGIAKSFQWKGTVAEFDIRENNITSSGELITAEDVAVSLKRLIILDSNTHGRLSSLICSDQKLTSLTDPCKDIVVSGNKLILKFKKKLPFLFSMLASIDYAIIPKSSIDKDSLKITNFENTTGPYFLKSTSNTEMILSKNINSYQSNENSPHQLRLIVPSQNLNAYEMLEAGKIDLIGTFDYSMEIEALLDKVDKEKYNIHRTMNINSNVLLYTGKGISSLTRERRLMIGKIIRTKILSRIGGNSSITKTLEFFPNSSEGGLNQNQYAQLEKIFNDITINEIVKEDLTLVVPKRRIGFFKEALQSSFPNLKVLARKSGEKFDGVKSSADMYIVETDTGFLEEISLIGYSVSYGFFGHNKDANQAWIEKYMKIEKKTDRLKALKALHLEKLLDPIMVPLYNTPYVAVSRNNLTMNFSEFYANSKLWLLSKK